MEKGIDMSIFLDKDSRLMVQGITGREGQFHTRQCIDYGTNVVAGVTPGKGGQKVDNVPVFDSVREAVDRTGADCSLIFVPPPFAADAILEAIDSNVRLIITITEGIPALDILKVKNHIKTHIDPARAYERTALVVDDEKVVAMGKMHESLSVGGNNELRMFGDIETARSWLTA